MNYNSCLRNMAPVSRYCQIKVCYNSDSGNDYMNVVKVYLTHIYFPNLWRITKELRSIVLNSINTTFYLYIISVSCVEISCLLLYSLNYYWFYILIRQTRMGLYFPTSLDLLYDYYVRIYTQNSSEISCSMLNEMT